MPVLTPISLLLASALLAACGADGAAPAPVTTEQVAAAAPAPPEATPMPLKVPFTNVSTCHDSLKSDAPELWAAFDGPLLATANGPGPAWERLDRVIAQQEEIFALWRTNGGSPRESQGPWDCSVADLAHALVDASVQELQGADEGTRKAHLDALVQLVQQEFSESASFLGMFLALQAALHPQP